MKDIKDENMRRLSTACKGLQDSLLDYANHKPSKTGKKKGDDKGFQEGSFKSLIEKIMEFNQLYKK